MPGIVSFTQIRLIIVPCVTDGQKRISQAYDVYVIQTAFVVNIYKIHLYRPLKLKTQYSNISANHTSQIIISDISPFDKK